MPGLTIALGQIPAATSTEIGTWLVCAAAVMVMVNQGKKLFLRQPPLEAEFTPRADFEQHKRACHPKLDRIEREFVNRTELGEFKREVRNELSVISARIASMSDVIGEKLDVMKSDLMAAGERRASALHMRINDVENLVNRVDERTKT
jgi:hypothetical protein